MKTYILYDPIDNCICAAVRMGNSEAAERNANIAEIRSVDWRWLQDTTPASHFQLPPSLSHLHINRKY